MKRASEEVDAAELLLELKRARTPAETYRLRGTLFELHTLYCRLGAQERYFPVHACGAEWRYAETPQRCLVCDRVTATVARTDDKISRCMGCAFPRQP